MADPNITKAEVHYSCHKTSKQPQCISQGKGKRIPICFLKVQQNFILYLGHTLFLALHSLIPSANTYRSLVRTRYHDGADEREKHVTGQVRQQDHKLKDLGRAMGAQGRGNNPHVLLFSPNPCLSISGIKFHLKQ